MIDNVEDFQSALDKAINKWFEIEEPEDEVVAYMDIPIIFTLSNKNLNIKGICVSREVMKMKDKAIPSKYFIEVLLDD